jgi:hypothetical protein
VCKDESPGKGDPLRKPRASLSRFVKLELLPLIRKLFQEDGLLVCTMANKGPFYSSLR